MRIWKIQWLKEIVEKNATKHGVSSEEVKYILEHPGLIQYAERGHVHGEDLYSARGRTAAGRLLIVYFVYKPRGVAMPISARDMSPRERRSYARKKKGQA